MNEPTLAKQIAALALVKADPSWNKQTLSCIRATLAMLTRLQAAEQNDIEKGRAIAAAMNKPNRT